MNRLERWQDLQAAVDAGMERLSSKIWTTLPVKVTAIDNLHDQQVITVQPLIKMRQRVRGEGGLLEWKDVSWPEIQQVPVKFPSGGGFTLTFPIKVGDEGSISVASRCMDNWWNSGGEQPQVSSNGMGSLRQHNPSDCFFELGGRAKPNALPNVSLTHTTLRSDDDQTNLKFNADGLTIAFMGANVFSLDKNGNLWTKGEITRGHGTGDQVTLGQHTHAQPVDSDGDTEAETNKPTAGT